MSAEPYPFASGPLLEQPNTYQYADCSGEDFLGAWRGSRCAAAVALGPAVPPEAPGSLGRAEPLAAAPARATAVLLDTLRRELVGENRKGALVSLDRLVQRFEVSKRVFGHYDDAYRAVDKSDYGQLGLYVAFGLLLEEAYRDTGCLTYLNGLLKLLDTLCACSLLVPMPLRGTVAWLIDREAGHVAALKGGVAP